jgi:MFS family permease
VSDVAIEAEGEAAVETSLAVAGPVGHPGFSTKPYRAFVLGMLMAIYGLNLLDRGLVSLLQEKIKPEFHLSDFELGLLGGPAFALCNAISSLPAARLAERYNRVTVLGLCTAAWSLFTALCGVVTSFPLLLLARFGVGVGEAGCLPPTQSMISDYWPANKRASAIAIHLTAIPLGTILASIVGAVVADHFGWRMAFIVLGAPGILVALIAKLTVREPPRTAASAAQADAPGFGAAMKELFSKRSFWHIALATGLVNFVAVGNGQYLVSFMIRMHHVSLTEVGLTLGPGLGLLTAASSFAVGKILNVLSERDRAWLARWPGIGVAIGVPISVGAYLAPSFAIMIGLQMFALLFTNSYLISLYTTSQGIVQPRVRATATAAVVIIINTIGYGMGPPVIGALSDYFNTHVVAFGWANAENASAVGLRCALICGSVVNLWASAHYLLGSRLLKRDWVG